MFSRLLVIALGTFLGFLGLSTPALAESKTVTLSVPGMYCEVCPITVKKALQKVAGVEKVSASFETKQAVVTFDDSKASVNKLREATAKAGYPSTVK
jgi:periplasmic mercuric ion binding protein